MDGKAMLKLNDDKPEYIAIESRQQRSQIDIHHININGKDIAPTSIVHNLSVMFDSEMDTQLKNIMIIKPFLDKEPANTTNICVSSTLRILFCKITIVLVIV